jgi:hypothetical protein
MSRKSELTFQEKFKGRMDNMGKDGIHGLANDIYTPKEKRRDDEMSKKGMFY